MTELENRYLAAKRALFDRYYQDLNDRQREAAFTVNGPLLILAGAGSGKTTVLVRRIAFLIRYGNAYHSTRIPQNLDEDTVRALEAAAEKAPGEIRPMLDAFADHPCRPYRILAVTFTNKAANEIKNRIVRILEDGGENPDDIWAGTFHSICARILRIHGGLLGYRPNFTIYDTDDSKKAFQQAMKNVNIGENVLDVKTVMAAVSRAKDRLLTASEYEVEAGSDYLLRQIARVYSAYEDLLRESNSMDFDDLIAQTVRLLRNHPQVLEQYQKRFEYVCVDEYQDTNPAQFELTRLLAGGYENLMVVGDEDQSIYKFRGATIENILTFDKTYPKAKVVRLEQNYRSTQTILDAANAVIGKNTERLGKTLWTAKGTGRKIHLITCRDQNDEAFRIIDLVTDRVAKGNATYRDFAILYRMNAQSQNLEKAFARSGIPYRILGGTRFSDREEIRDITAYLQLIVNHDDNLRLNRIINKPTRKIGARTVEAVRLIAEETGASQFSVIEHAGDYKALGNARAALEQFAGVIQRLTEDLRELPMDVFFDRVLDMTGYRQMWEAKGEAEAERLENLDEFKSQIMEYMDENDEPTMEGFLEEAALVADVDRYDETADAVVLMTMHSAKGLEFPNVILPGMEEGIFPSQRAIDDSPSALEEERRLAYVAITRAKEELFLIHATVRLLYGRTCMNELSRFAGDIPKELTVSEGSKKESPMFGGDSYRWGGGGASPFRKRINYPDLSDIDIDELASDIDAQDRKRSSGAGFGTIDEKVDFRKKPKAMSNTFPVGSRVRHLTFGEGEIISAKAVGPDILYEIMFDRAGTKKLMGSYAKLKKI